MGLLKDKTRRPGKLDGSAPHIEFGRVYRDRITGFEGTCTGYTSYISGCDQVLLQPQWNPENKEASTGRWLDDDRCIDVESEQQVATESGRGADMPAPIR